MQLFEMQQTARRSVPATLLILCCVSKERGASSRSADHHIMRSNEKHLRQLVALQDRERRLLACEIHDGFVQDVVSVQLAIDALLERLLKTDPESVEPLLRIRAMVRTAIDASRRLVGDLRPPLADDLSLADAVQYLVDHEQTIGRLSVEFTHNLQVQRLEPLLQSTVVRIVQEALNNVARHAEVRAAKVELTQTGSTLGVVVTDHGRGFDPQHVQSDRYGLTGIRERARLFDGKASIHSRPGKGTTVTVELPISS